MVFAVLGAPLPLSGPFRGHGGVDDSIRGLDGVATFVEGRCQTGDVLERGGDSDAVLDIVSQER